MNKYVYSGPVVVFGNCVQNNWRGETFATSEAKAKSNLAYQWKKMHNRTPTAKIALPGDLKLVN